MSLDIISDDFVPVAQQRVKIKSMPTKEERSKFSNQIEAIVLSHKLSYIEAIMHHCEETGMEVEVAATLLNDIVKSRIEAEAQELRYLPRGSALPL